MFLAMKTGRYALVRHRFNAAAGTKTKPVKIFETYWTRSKLVLADNPLGKNFPKVRVRVPAPPAKTYAPNGKREVARRLRQMEVRAHV